MTTRGKLVFTILFLALVAFGVQKYWPKLKPGKAGSSESHLVETKTEVPRLDPAGEYHSKDNIVDVELSVYAGYAGIIAANGGLDPNDNSIFAKKYGFKVRIKLSEEESWSALTSGKMAASATTVDVLAVYGRQFGVTVPLQIGFSRGADGIVVQKEIKKVNDLKGKVLASSQFTESDFFIRYLAQEAGLPVKMLASLAEAADPNAVNLVYSADADEACQAYTTDASGKIVGCVTWEPNTTDTVKDSGGKSQILTTNRNLLIVADILVVNKGFAAAEPEKVKGLTAGIIEGNMLVRENPDPYLDIIAKAFTKPNGKPEDKWDRARAKEELKKIHFANGPENLAFFGGAMDAAGSFSGIFQTAVLSYGSELLKNPVDAENFANIKYLKELDAAGAFKDQKIAIAPIKSGRGGGVETDPLLSKNIRFLFEANKAVLDLNKEENLKNLSTLKQMLQVSPGSEILLRGHVDNANIPEFLKKGGEAFLREKALDAMTLSKERAEEIRQQLVKREKVDPARLKVVGRGWEEPLGKNSDENRRVEAQWFTLE